jgi:hypothetical protein
MFCRSSTSANMLPMTSPNTLNRPSRAAPYSRCLVSLPRSLQPGHTSQLLSLRVPLLCCPVALLLVLRCPTGYVALAAALQLIVSLRSLASLGSCVGRYFACPSSYGMRHGIFQYFQDSCRYPIAAYNTFVITMDMAGQLSPAAAIQFH